MKTGWLIVNGYLKSEKFELLKDEGIINSTNIEKRKSNAKI